MEEGKGDARRGREGAMLRPLGGAPVLLETRARSEERGREGGKNAKEGGRGGSEAIGAHDTFLN